MSNLFGGITITEGTGIAGAPGAAGAPGLDGVSGEDGDPGIPGPAGAAGAAGATGPQGIQGPIGPSGPPGLDGLDGEDGIQGPPGLDLTSTLSIRKTADESVTDATIQADNELTVNLEGTSSYWFFFTLFFTNGGVGEGFKCDLSGTVGVSTLKAQVFIYDDALNSLAAFARVTALNSAVGSGISMGDNFARILGVIEVSTPGTFLVRWAQNVTGAGAGVTVQEDSSLILRKLNA